MKPPVSMEPSPSPAAQRRAEPGPLRVLVVAGEGSGGLLLSLRQWAPDMGIEVEAAPDLPRAVRQLAAQRWDVVLAVLGERADDDVTWWVEALRGAAGSPQLLAAAHRPSMGLVLRAEKLGVLDLLSLPARREDLQRTLDRVRAVATEVPLPLPEAEPHAVGPYALVGQSPAMLEVYKLMARVAQSSATVLVQGESGTGKEVIARAIHLNGAKASGPFVAVNWAAIREDLYYRLAVVTIRLPTLAERGDDLVLLTAYFVRHFAERYGKRIGAFSDRALELLRNHTWVGNVRELRNVIERAVIVATDETLRVEHLPDELRGEEAALPDRPSGAHLTLAEVEARHIARVLARTKNQIGAAAEVLGIHRNTLTRKMKEYGL